MAEPPNNRLPGPADIMRARRGRTLAVIKGCPHAAAARQLVDYLLSPAVEAELKRLLRQSALVNTLADFCALIAQPPAQ